MSARSVRSPSADTSSRRPLVESDQRCVDEPRTVFRAGPRQRRLHELLGLPRRPARGRRRRGWDRVGPARIRRRRRWPGGCTRWTRQRPDPRSADCIQGGHMTAVIPDERVEGGTEGKVAHFTAAERALRGRAARAEVPRASHSALEVPSDRDPVALLEEQATTRVAELVPIRYGRMLVSPFTFYRGAAKIMAHDLAATPRTGLTTQLCGDAHLSNFGGFASPERSLVFDLNDFDETLPGPFEWDVKRLAASFEVAGRNRNLTAKERRTAVLTAVRSYREAMREFAAMRNLEVWYSRLDICELEEQLRRSNDAKQARAVARGAVKAETKDSMRALSRLT